MSSHSITDKELLAQATRTTDINYDEDEQLLLQAEQQLPEEAEVTKEVCGLWVGSDEFIHCVG